MYLCFYCLKMYARYLQVYSIHRSYLIPASWYIFKGSVGSSSLVTRRRMKSIPYNFGRFVPISLWGVQNKNINENGIDPSVTFSITAITINIVWYLLSYGNAIDTYVNNKRKMSKKGITYLFKWCNLFSNNDRIIKYIWICLSINICSCLYPFEWNDRNL